MNLETAIKSRQSLLVRTLTLRLALDDVVTDREVIEVMADVKVVVHDFDLSGIEGNRQKLLAVLTAISSN